MREFLLKLSSGLNTSLLKKLDLIQKILKNNLVIQLLRFGIIGISAAIVHFLIVIALVQTLLLKPLIANIFAFCIAFQVSYWGHRNWTFQGTTSQHREAFPKLLLISTCTFIANESLFSFFLYVTNLPYPLALFLVLTILPVMTFGFSKFWVFR